MKITTQEMAEKQWIRLLFPIMVITLFLTMHTAVIKKRNVSVETLMVNVYGHVLEACRQKQELSQKIGDKDEELSYCYFFRDFNQDGYEEMILCEYDRTYRGTLSAYSYENQLVLQVWECGDESAYENIYALTEDGFVLRGMSTSGKEHWLTYYRMEDGTFVWDTSFWWNETGYYMEKDGVIDIYTEKELQQLMKVYEEERVVQEKMENVWINLTERGFVFL